MRSHDVTTNNLVVNINAKPMQALMMFLSQFVQDVCCIKAGIVTQLPEIRINISFVASKLKSQNTN